MSSENLKIVIIGGGHGPSAFRVGLTEKGIPVVSLVNNSDSGGSRGILGKDYDSSLAGDLTRAWSDQCIYCEDARLLNHRYSNGSLHPHRAGNIIFQSALEMYKETDSVNPIMDALRYMKRKYPISGEVLPITLDRRDLCSVLEDGSILPQEHLMDERESGSPIRQVYLSDEAIIFEEARKRILEAQIILLGPGSIWGSICSTLLPKGVPEVIRESGAFVAYAANIANVTGQTDGWDLNRYIGTVEKYLQKSVDAVIYFTTDITSMSGKIRDAYEKVGQNIINLDGLRPDYRERLLKYDLVTIDSVEENGTNKPVFRHFSVNAANAVLDIASWL